MFTHRLTISSFRHLLIFLVFGMLVAGCARPAAPTSTTVPPSPATAPKITSIPSSTPQAVAVMGTPVVNIVINPTNTKVQVGQEIAISTEVTGRNPKVTWSAQKGTLSRTEGLSVIFTAPNEPGKVTIDITIAVDTGATTRSVTFDIMQASTSTPTATVIPPTRAPTPTVTSTTTPTRTITMPTGTITITINDPQNGGVARCPVPSPQLCIFAVTGGSSGVTGDLKIRAFVKPVNPPGDMPGYWYVDGKAYSVNETGDWSADLQIGNPQYPAQPGATLTIMAWVVTPAESAKLDKQIGIAINPTAQASYVAKSSEVNLTVNRSQ